MTQQSGTQFDDDLTVGFDSDESFSSDAMDLFEFTGDEDSPIGKLKTIILSIDWEITDDILCQLEDELIDLADVWADDKIKQVYVQGLSKIGKYIYKEKANAHPDSIKLLLTFFHNLEKIATSAGSMSEIEQKNFLVKDIAKFDKLKSQISPSEPSQESSTPSPVAPVVPTDENVLQLKELKTRILGLEWEVNDLELQGISDEVQRLETVFNTDKAKLILLQGIGALGSYINIKRSRSNGTSFKLLRSFYDVLEKNCSSDISTTDGNQLLLEEVEKFKAFKAEIAQEQVASDIQPEKTPHVKNVSAPVPEEDLTKALPVDFIDEKEKDVESDVDSRLESVFGNTENEFDDQSADESIALEGVKVETEADDDSDEEALPYEDGGIAPALAEADEESSFSVEKLAGDLAEFSQFDEQEESVSDSVESLYDEDVTTETDEDLIDDVTLFDDVAPAFADDPDEDGLDEEISVPESDDSDTADLDNKLDSFFDDEVNSSSDEWNTDQQSKNNDEDSVTVSGSDTDDADLLQGIDVETEADDDSDEEALPYEDGEIVPALAGSTDTEEFIENLQADDKVDIDSEDLDESLNVLFDDEDSVTVLLPDDVNEDEEELSTDDAFLFSDDDSEEDIQGEVVAALSDISDSLVGADSIEQSIDDRLSFFDDDEVSPAVGEYETDEIEEDSEDVLSFLDDDAPAPALEDIAESALQNEITEEDTTDVDLSFLDDEISSPELEGVVGSTTDDEIVEIEEPEVDTIDIDVSSFDGETIVSDENDVSEADLEVSTEDVLPDVSVSTEEIEADEIDSFHIDDEPAHVLAEETEVVAETSTDDEDSISIDGEQDDIEAVEESIESVDLQHSEENEDIDFTVPGEVVMASTAVTSKVKESQTDDVIEFTVPGEETAEIEDSVFETGNIVFEVVDDDVEVDLLPDEEFHDSDDMLQPIQDDKVELAEGKKATEKSFLKYSVLGELVGSLQGNITEEGIQDVLNELNSLRYDSSSTVTSKIFLQLLSSISQNIQKVPSEINDTRLNLMEDVMSGLHSSTSQDVIVSQVQEKLLFCISQVLLLNTNTSSDMSKIVETPEASSTDEPISNTEEINEVSDEQLKAIVHEELADIKSTFLDEISTIRKEFVDK
ncbi:MAG: hypothetical protein KAR01_01005 [Desulfocapsa sp.]|nr:hypothetical protein [Desulfocapsa sp.]